MPSPNDKEELKAWLEKNKDLTTYELVLLTKKSPSTIRNWKRKFGLSLKDSPFSDVKHVRTKKDIEVIEDADIWDNEEWFRQKYEKEGLGAPTIARMINRSIVLVTGRLKRFGIRVRSHNEAVKSKSKFCNREWLSEHYVNKHWSLKRCAKEAKVVPYTIYNWLVKFGIEPRSIHQAMAGNNNPFFGRTHSDETKKKIMEAVKAKLKRPHAVST